MALRSCGHHYLADKKETDSWQTVHVQGKFLGSTGDQQETNIQQEMRFQEKLACCTTHTMGFQGMGGVGGDVVG